MKLNYYCVVVEYSQEDLETRFGVLMLQGGWIPQGGATVSRLEYPDENLVRRIDSIWVQALAKP